MPNRISRGKVMIGSGGFSVVGQGTLTHAAGTIAGAGGTVYTFTGAGTVPTGAAVGDIVEVAPNYPAATMGTATWRGFVSGAGTVSYSITNAAGTCIWSAGTVTYQIKRNA